MGNVARLLEADFLERARRSPLARFAPGRPGVRVVAAWRGGLLAVAALLVYAPAFLLAPRPLPGLLGTPATLADLAALFFLYFGLFAGAWQVCDHVLLPNERMLALPITLRDLTRFRLIEAGRSAATTAAFFTLPLIALSYRSAGWDEARLPLVLLVHLVAELACFATGIAVMLLLLRLLRGARPEVVFLSIFLGSVWLLVAALRLGWREGGAALVALQGFSPAALLARSAAPHTPFLPAAVLLFAGLASLLGALAGAAERALSAAYVAAHRRGSAGNEVPLPERAPTPGYSGVSRALRFLPVSARALLARDVLSVARHPHLWVRVLSVAVPLLLLPTLGARRVDDPGALAVYLFAAFLGTRLFLDSGSADLTAGPTVRRSFPSARAYLGARLLIVVTSTLALLVPVLATLAWCGSWGPFGLVRALLAAADVVVASALLVPFSALLARRSGSGWGAGEEDEHPTAVLLFFTLGAAAPYFFYRLDLALRGRALLGTAGALAGTAALLFVVALNTYAAATCFRRSDPLART